MRTNKMALCGLFAALLCICAWLAIPLGDVAVTMQTFGIFLCLLLLGGKYGSLSIFLYLLMGAVGLPVFARFQGGLGILLGPTGGYIWGFGVAALLYWCISKAVGQIPALILGLVLCYTLGSLWYLLYAGGGLWAVLIRCVLPFLVPDAVKLILAVTLYKQLKKHL